MKYTIDLPNDIDSFTLEHNDTKQLWIPVKVYKVKKICPECGGEMIGTGELVYLTSPLQYQHKCEDCGYEDCYLEAYPCIKYEEEQNG